MPDKDEPKKEKQKYKVLIGINYPGVRGEVRADAGRVVDNIPEASALVFLRQHAIEKYELPQETEGED